MKRIPLVILATAFAVFLVACSKTENTSNSNSNKNSGSAAGTAGSSNSNSATTASTADKIGVPECDDYIAKYESCVRSKVPEMARAQLESSLKTARENWKKAAENATTRGTLAAACKQANDAAAASMKAYGCSF
jgi:hypothetical protein